MLGTLKQLLSNTIEIDPEIPVSEQAAVKESAERLQEVRKDYDRWKTQYDVCKAALGLSGQSSSVSPEEQWQARQDIGEAERESGRWALTYAKAARAHDALVQQVRSEIIRHREPGEKAAVLRLNTSLEQARASNEALLAYQSQTEALVETAYPKTIAWHEFSQNTSGDCRLDQWQRFMKSEGKL